MKVYNTGGEDPGSVFQIMRIRFLHYIRKKNYQVALNIPELSALLIGYYCLGVEFL
jgi:hypothetical protein